MNRTWSARELLRLAGRAAQSLRAEGAQAAWARFERYTGGSQARIFASYRRRLTASPGGPRLAIPRTGERVAVVVPVRDPPPALLGALWRSLRTQHYASWELILGDDGSREPASLAGLRQLAGQGVTVVRSPGRGISAATNAAVAASEAPLIAFADQDDLLHPEALGSMAAALAAHPEREWAYSDEDKLDPLGQRGMPCFKPAWDPLLLLAWPYPGHLTVVRRAAFEALGGLEPELDGAQDHDLFLRLSERGPGLHVPQVVYHWRSRAGSAAASPAAKPWAREAGRRAVAQALERQFAQGGQLSALRAEPGIWPGTWRLGGPPPQGLESVSLIAPSDHPCPWASDLGLGELLRAGATQRAALAARARGPYLLFWGALRPLGPPRELILSLLRLASLPGVGLVSGVILKRERELENGLYPDAEGLGRPLEPAKDGAPGYFGLLACARSAPAVSGELLLIRRDVLLSLGGWPQRGEGALPGVQLSQRAWAAGWRVAVEPRARAILTRRAWPAPSLPGDLARVGGSGHPWLNPNLTLGPQGLDLEPHARAHEPR